MKTRIRWSQVETEEVVKYAHTLWCTGNRSPLAAIRLAEQGILPHDRQRNRNVYAEYSKAADMLSKRIQASKEGSHALKKKTRAPKKEPVPLVVTEPLKVEPQEETLTSLLKDLIELRSKEVHILSALLSKLELQGGTQSKDQVTPKGEVLTIPAPCLGTQPEVTPELVASKAPSVKHNPLPIEDQQKIRKPKVFVYGFLPGQGQNLLSYVPSDLRPKFDLFITNNREDVTSHWKSGDFLVMNTKFKVKSLPKEFYVPEFSKTVHGGFTEVSKAITVLVGSARDLKL